MCEGQGEHLVLPGEDAGPYDVHLGRQVAVVMSSGVARTGECHRVNYEHGTLELRSYVNGELVLRTLSLHQIDEVTQVRRVAEGWPT